MSKTKMSRDLEKLLKPIVEDFARDLQNVLVRQNKKTDLYVADLLKEAANKNTSR